MYSVEYGVGDRMKNEGVLTEIATYMWPGFLAEWNESSQEFHAWRLDAPTLWTLCPEITAPPSKCIATISSQVRVLHQQGLYLVQSPEPEPVWRVLRLQEPEQQQQKEDVLLY
jgi:hypothetical protein